MNEYEPDGDEWVGYELRGHELKKGSWFGRASWMLGVLAFGTAFLSFVGATAYLQAHNEGRPSNRNGEQYGYMLLALVVYLLALVITMVPAFGSVVAGSIAVVRGERSWQLLVPGLVWLVPVLVFLCYLLLWLSFVIR